ncbi:thiamine pyrophosphate-dependent dehydrogenase E1 component subunit alpha [Mycolicibacterium confluentis]|uniref:Acetoin:2,6-dichlorophenolindophenol oxidoreductase subunit alpha n=1 Tax=Mycolicibacterium confluentis TaxID=28047 RepID=A0A7I7Y3G8_9MYCO|nr:thiamine pyrophosphate-dependent dehydrogenase E1 component subunit alpha [Mycolicibacterium confluentis]MCV7318339.1 thiamine pyrophosphate-dependent dehydrogenase E1 component subunit alpha [Mycolicibacterium confluentis]ORV29649.1 pyruvate dehydrogenase [Mycolicibacterium confluentis]BBZ36250.1 acetoin:2,6-dichlorophenolindophenol oxidoreductase subunit alpha [Mycolicibacterium confluentis]
MTTIETGLDQATLVGLYRTAARIKSFDETYRAQMMSGKFAGMYYSPRGQEFAAASVAAHLRPADYVVTTYRGLHDQIAKGVPLRDLWAEYLGRSAGTCRGKGGPMHVTSPKHGLMVTTGVVGSGLPIANGLALAAQMRGTDQVAVVNFGDGASNIGAFHESLNLASLWKLPVIFVCQNNKWAEYTPLAGGTTVANIADRAVAYSMAGATVNGNDPVELYDAAGQAIERARGGGGPTLLEAVTYRFCGHYFGDQSEYIPAEELADANAADPIPLFRQRLIDEFGVAAEELDEIDRAAQEEVNDAAEWAYEQPLPDPSELTTDVYAEETVR